LLFLQAGCHAAMGFLLSPVWLNFQETNPNLSSTLQSARCAGRGSASCNADAFF
jgi:hypothetical protein